MYQCANCGFKSDEAHERESALERENVTLRARVKELEEAPLNLPAAVEAKKAVVEREALLLQVDDIFRLHATSKRSHGTCTPRSERSCTACNAKDDLAEILERGAVRAQDSPLLPLNREQERCAKIAESLVSSDTDWDTSYWNQACAAIAAKIRKEGR